LPIAEVGAGFHGNGAAGLIGAARLSASMRRAKSPSGKRAAPESVTYQMRLPEVGVRTHEAGVTLPQFPTKALAPNLLATGWFAGPPGCSKLPLSTRLASLKVALASTQAKARSPLETFGKHIIGMNLGLNGIQPANPEGSAGWIESVKPHISGGGAAVRGPQGRKARARTARESRLRCRGTRRCRVPRRWRIG
jgi:hypothetical protein